LPHIVEKDYVLGWILAGINAHEELSESWVFKGGTCLKKCYFETYRFSEDLDFTLRNENHLDEEFLRRVFEEVVSWATDQSGLNIPADQLEMLSYANDLISKTQGRASYSMEFSHYDYVPNELAERVIAAHKTAHGEQLVEEEA
jgi:predicted nucleotidyltransferase component of viral defense system